MIENVYLKPYFLYDGIPSFRDTVLIGFYQRMASEGTLRQVNFEGTLPDEHRFVAAVKSSFYFANVMDDARSVGIVWLNRYEHRRVHIHFCFWKHAWGEACRQIGAFTVRSLLDLKLKDDSLAMDCIWGAAPASNRLLTRYVLSIGGLLSGRIKNYIWDHRAQQSVDGHIYYFTRETMR